MVSPNWYGTISHQWMKTVNDMTFCCQWHHLLKLVAWIIRLLHISLWKTMEKSGIDSGYHYITVIFISNIWISASVKINWLCTWTLVVRTAAFKRTEKKLHGFSQTDTVEFLIDERKLSMIKLRLHFLICQQPLIQRNRLMLFHKEWLAPSTTLPPNMARDIRRTV